MNLVKIIDEKGHEIGCIDRSLVVPLGLRHQVARVIIYSETTDQVLLQQRSPFKDSCPNLWDTSASGHVDAHEQPKTAALRELSEELGIKTRLSKLTLVGKLSSTEEIANGTLNREVLVYLLKAPAASIKPSINKREVERVQWLPIKKALADKLAPGVTPGAKIALELLANYLS